MAFTLSLMVDAMFFYIGYFLLSKSVGNWAAGWANASGVAAEKNAF